jgi:hypothetical protein
MSLAIASLRKALGTKYTASSVSDKCHRKENTILLHYKYLLAVREIVAVHCENCTKPTNKKLSY